jgi:hypothetical protein
MPVRFRHSEEIWRDYPSLVPGVLFASGITPDASVSARTEKFLATAKSRLAEMPEGEMPQIQAWRRAFARMGLKPTQYRCASESLLRRPVSRARPDRGHPHRGGGTTRLGDGRHHGTDVSHSRRTDRDLAGRPAGGDTEQGRPMLHFRGVIATQAHHRRMPGAY